MCLGIPMKVIKRDGDTAVAEAGGIRKDVRLDLVSDVDIGDYILIHTGFAIEKLDPKEALETLELIKDVYRAGMTGVVDETDIDPKQHPDKDPK
ncbi:MAG: HypC/HybG/HupF family hydrogenase formation chaperone [bacterium]|nr:MAG: HypC/HybG/HupF family hydrogenase formation chaperone [bacterium]